MEETKTFGEITADDAAKIADSVLSNEGMQSSAFKLLYQALTVEPENERASKVLIGVVESLTNDRVTVALADHLLGYVRDAHFRKLISASKNFALYRLGLLTHKSQAVPPPAEAWEDVENEFVLDNGGYENLRSELLLSREGALFEAIYRLIGVKSGLLKKVDFAGESTLEDMYSGEFIRTPEYEEFLKSEKLQLD